MADKSIEDLVISISYDVKKLVDSSKIIDKSISNTVKNAESSFKGLFNIVGTGFAALGGATAGLAMIRSFAQAGTQAKYLSDTLGTGVKNLSLMEQVAKRFGGTKEGIDATLSSIKYRVVKNQFQQDPVLNASLQAIGAGSLYNSDGSIKDPAETLIQIAQAERKSKGGINSNSSLYINQALGIDQNSIRAFAQNPNTLNNTISHVNSLGVFDDKSANAANETTNAINDLTQSFETLTRVVGTMLTPVISGLANIIGHDAKFLSLPLADEGKIIKDVFKANLNKVTTLLHNNVSKYIGITPMPANGLWNSLDKNNIEPGLFNVDQSGNLNNYSNKANNSTAQIPGRHYPSQSLRLQQLLQESNGNVNAIGGYNEKELTYGLAQFRLSTAKQVLKDAGLNSNIDKNYLLNPQNSVKLQQLYLNQFANKAQDMGINDPNRIDDLALAGYNGGLAGFNNTLKNNRSFNNYIGKVRSQSINAGSTNSTAMNNTNHITNINVENVHLPNVNSPEKFADGLKTNPMTRSAYAFGTFNVS